MNSLDKFKIRMESPEFKESARKYVEEYFKEREERKQRVSSKGYIKWLYNYVSSNERVDTESALYIYKDIDAENGQILDAFFDYIKGLATKQRVLVVPDDECKFPSELVVVKIEDKYFECFRMYGQGSWTSVSLLEKEPDYAYVKLPN